jgi:hypothetical protein
MDYELLRRQICDNHKNHLNQKNHSSDKPRATPFSDSPNCAFLRFPELRLSPIPQATPFTDSPSYAFGLQGVIHIKVLRTFPTVAKSATIIKIISITEITVQTIGMSEAIHNS